MEHSDSPPTVGQKRPLEEKEAAPEIVDELRSPPTVGQKRPLEEKVAAPEIVEESEVPPPLDPPLPDSKKDSPPTVGQKRPLEEKVAALEIVEESEVPPPPDPPLPDLKKERCWWFDKKGTCKYGQACYFAHGEGEAGNSDASGKASPQVWQRASKQRGSKSIALLCKWFQAGCCSTGAECEYKHCPVSQESGRKTKRCELFVSTGNCPNEDCFYAHGDQELRIPLEFAKTVGYKRSLCTFYMRDDIRDCSKESYKCFDAHGVLDLRSLPIRLPTDRGEIAAGTILTCIADNTSIWIDVAEYKQIGLLEVGATITASGPPEKNTGYIMLPIAPTGAVDLRSVKVLQEAPGNDETVQDVDGLSYEFTDAHLHLDQVVLSRKYGNGWLYKSILCKFQDCPYGADICTWAHGEADMLPRPPYSIEDFNLLVEDMGTLQGGKFAGCVTSCCGLDTIEETLRLVAWGREKLDGRVYAAFGIHPATFEQYTPEVEARLEAALESCGSQGVAWGECGLDYNKRLDDMDKNPKIKEGMQEVFRQQCRVAIRRGLPLVVHSRDAVPDTFEVLREVVPAAHHVYLHSFMGNPEQALEFLNHWTNGYIGIAGAVTWPIALGWKGGLADVARAVPLDRLLLETDGPFMAPTPHRGEESHPGHVTLIATAIARFKGQGLSMSDVLTATNRNFRSFYRLDGDTGHEVQVKDRVCVTS